MQRLDALEDGVPIRPAKVRRRPQSRDCILFGIRVVNHDIRGIVGLDLCGKISVDLDEMADILSLDGQKKRAEPFKRSKVTANPEEIHLVETRLLLRIVGTVPDGLEDAGEGSDTDTGTHKNGYFVFEDVFGSGTVGTVNENFRALD